MDYYERIAGNFQKTIELIAMSVDTLAGPLEEAGQIMANSLLADHKIMACGNGADTAMAQVFVSSLLNCLENERPALPAMALGQDPASLTAIASNNGLADIYSRQIRALGQEGDVLFCIASSDFQPNLDEALSAARERKISAVILSHEGDHLRGSKNRDGAVELVISRARKPRITEVQAMTIHSLCEIIELNLFGVYDQD
jgi:DnaA initiator-associating protein